jgi:hypothetical protein
MGMHNTKAGLLLLMGSGVLLFFNGCTKPETASKLPPLTNATSASEVSPGGHGLGANLHTSGNYTAAPPFNFSSTWSYLSGNKMATNFSTQTSALLILQHPPYGNQLQTGSCVSWSLGYTAKTSLDETFGNTKEDGEPRSGWYLYNLVHYLADDPADDGLDPYVTIEDAQAYGVASQAAEPSLPTPLDADPTTAQTNSAATDKVGGFSAVTSTAQILQSLELGLPVTFAFNFFNDFETAFDNGTVWSTLNSPGEGGHQVCVIGYDFSNGDFLLENQWGYGGDATYTGCVWVTTSVINTLLTDDDLELFALWNSTGTTSHPASTTAEVNGGSTYTFRGGGGGTPPYTGNVTITASPGQTVTVTLTQNDGGASGTWYSSLNGLYGVPLFSTGAGLAVTTPNSNTVSSSAQVIMPSTGSAVFSFFGFFGYSSSAYCEISVQ